MDLQSALVCVLVFVVSAAILLLISMFGMKEKSYEEALAEQRKLTSGLLGTGQKPKPKEKKQKKAGKKVKEKTASAEVETVEEVDAAEEETSAHSKLHVEFEEPAVVEPQIKKRTKKEKVRSILLNKEKSPVAETNVSNALPVNHFETIHPKDEFELLHAHQKEEALKQEPEPKGKPSKAKKSEKVEKVEPEPEPPKPKSKGKQQPQAQPIVEETPVAEPVSKVEAAKTVKSEPKTAPKAEPAKPEPPKTAPVVQPTNNNVKDKKKKKSEFNTLQQMTGGDRPGVNVSLLVPLVRKADLSRSEIQILIDLLLNKQHEAPTVLDEWSEGKADPVQKLKKQLAEKERALTDEQEAMVGVQAKLREVRAELNAERSRLLQSIRTLEESLQAKHTELQTVNARNHTQNQKLQQMQAQLNEEVMTARKLREEHNAFQIQRKKLEMHLSSINDQQQEAESTFQTQLSHVRLELQEQQNLNNQLNIELRTLQEKSHQEKEMLQERIRIIENQAHHMKNELDQKQDIVRQLEESHRKLSEMEHNISITHHHENELKLRCQQHLDDARRLEKSQAQSHEDLNKLHAENARLTAANKQQLEQHNTLVAQLRTEITQLQSEKTKLEAATGEATANKAKEVEVLNLQNELSSLKAKLQQNETQMNADLENSKKTIKEMESELEEQRNKNDELRKKNWKVMEALNTAESSLRAKPKQTESDPDAIKKQIKVEEQENNRKFLQRLFPDLKIPNSDQWMSSAEKMIKSHMSSLQTSAVPSENSDVSKLQAQLAHYRTIINDTEGILNKLETHVEQEERKWRITLAEKDSEIDKLKEQTKNQLQVQIEDLESRLSAELQVRQDLEKECQALKARATTIPVTDSKHTQFGNLAEKEKASEENSRLAEELSKERQRSRDLSEELLRLQTQNTDTLHSKSPQNHTSNGTSLEIIDSENASNN